MLPLIGGIALTGLGKAFGGGNKSNGGLSWMEQKLYEYAYDGKYEGFLPNESVFQEQAKADEARVLAELPISVEAFNSDLASRGIYSSGEASKHLYGQVYAPIAREMASVRASARLGFMQARLNAMSQMKQMQFGALTAMGQYKLGLEGIKAQKDSSKWGAIGSVVGTGIGLAFGGKG